MAWTDPIDTAVTGVVAPAAMWNEVRDNFALVGPHLIVRKPTDESVTSNTTLQNDDHLILPVAANEVWRFNFDLLLQAGVGEFKVAMTFPTGGTLSYTIADIDNTGATFVAQIGTTTSPSTSTAWDPLSATIPSFFRIPGVYVNGANAGNLTLQWAQNVSNATATTVKANSTLYAAKIA